jgi:hypothetical protein
MSAKIASNLVEVGTVHHSYKSTNLTNSVIYSFRVSKENVLFIAYLSHAC